MYFYSRVYQLFFENANETNTLQKFKTFIRYFSFLYDWQGLQPLPTYFYCYSFPITFATSLLALSKQFSVKIQTEVAIKLSKVKTLKKP